MNSNITSSFSWQRVKLTTNYYAPLFRKQLIVYLMASLVIGLSSYSCVYNQLPPLLSGGCISFLSILYFVAPMILSQSDDRMITTMLPATALEKWMVLIAYFIFIVPIVLIVPIICIQLVSNIVTPHIDILHYVYLEKINGEFPLHLGTLYLFDQLVPPASCLWAMLKFRRNRVVKSLILLTTEVFALMITGIIYATYIVSNFAKETQEMYDATIEISKDRLVQEILDKFIDFYNALGIASIAVFIFFAWLTYHSIKKKQI